MLSYGIVLFARDSGELLLKTLSRIKIALALGQLDQVAVIVIDDGSSQIIELDILKDNLENMNIRLNFELLVERCEKPKGLGNAFKIGCEKLLEIYKNPQMMVTQLPANDQVQELSILSLLLDSSEKSVLSTWRENLEIRPFPKRFFSSIMHFFVRTTLFPQVKQFTSNYTVPLWLSLKYVPDSSRHAFGLWLLLGAHTEGLELRQVPISLVAEYGKRPRSLAVRKWHRPTDLIFFGMNYLRILRISRRARFKVSY